MREKKRFHPENNEWTRVLMEEPFSREMSAWCYENCIDMVYGGNFWRARKSDRLQYVVEFVNPIDATAFALKWLR